MIRYCRHQQCDCLINPYYNHHQYILIKTFDLCDDMKYEILLNYIAVCHIKYKDYVLKQLQPLNNLPLFDGFFNDLDLSSKMFI